MAANGRLDLSTLVLVDGWAYLAPATAAAWNAACNEMVARGYPRPTITAPDGAYRTFARQVYWKAYWKARGLPGNAATPGYSNHGWGTDVDIYNVAKFPRAVLVEVFESFGFTFNVPSELWHAHHDGVALAGIDPKPIGDTLSAAEVQQIITAVTGITNTQIQRATRYRMYGNLQTKARMAFNITSGDIMPNLGGDAEVATWQKLQLVGNGEAMVWVEDALYKALIDRAAIIRSSSAAIDAAVLAKTLAPLLKTGASVADIEAALADEFAAIPADVRAAIIRE